MISPEELGKWIEVSDEDAKKVFEQRRERFGTPEKREVSQMFFPNESEAQAARGRITSGTSFDDVAKERNLNLADVDLGMIAKSAIIDPAIADAAFSLPSGEVSQPVQGRFGVALVKIGKWTEVTDEDAKKVFEQNRDRLGSPEKREVQQIVFPSEGEAQAARARITSGMSFDDLAKERNLNLADVDLGMIAKTAIIDPAIADAAFALPSGEVSQPVQGQFGVALVKIGKIEPGTTPTFESVAAQVKKELATERARAKVNEIQNKMEDERSGGANVVEASQKLGLTPITIDAVDRSGRKPDGQPVTNIPRGLDVVSQAFNSDVGVDNEPIQFGGGYVWYDVLGITPSRERALDEVRSQVEAKWREDQISSKLRAKATEMVQKVEQGSTLATEAAAAGSKVETATGFRRDASLSGVPSAAITAAFRTAKDGVGQTPGAGGSEWIVFRVTDVTMPPVDAASEELKKLKDTLQRGLTDEQVAQYVTKIESEIGTSINQAAFAQVTGANN